MEPSPEKYPSRYAEDLKLKTVSDYSGTVDTLPILNPTKFRSFAWRDILEHQLHAESPLTITAIDLLSGETTIIGTGDFLKANYYSNEQVKRFLDDGVNALENSTQVIMMRARST